MMDQAQIDRWAVGAINRRPGMFETRGLGYEAASRRAQAICKAAGETGKTINAYHWLCKLHDEMRLTARREAA